MNREILVVEPSGPLCGSVELSGAKNASLVMIAGLLLVRGVSRLCNVPNLSDVHNMTAILESLGARVLYAVETHELIVDTSYIEHWIVKADMMQKTRASILVLGALLARSGSATVSFPGGDAIGARPIDYHIKGLKKLGVEIEENGGYIYASGPSLQAARIVLEYPSVGATENIILAATAAKGTTTIINAALEPEIFDFIQMLCAMGAYIRIEAPATIHIEGARPLSPITYTIMCDRLEAGTLLLAAAATGGDIYLPDAQVDNLDIFLLKLQEMGHTIFVDYHKSGIRLIATSKPTTVSYKTGPYPSFPSDLQAPMMVVQCSAQGTSIVEETVFENRLLHVPELIKMGACITIEQSKAFITGGTHLHGASVHATDIRASSALVLAGLSCQRENTYITGVHHWRRGYDALEAKLVQLGAKLYCTTKEKSSFSEPSFSATVQLEIE